MRVVAGTARGIRLQPPSTNETRPISDRAKEALFNILSPKIRGHQFLDLFAGTGGVGIEALSRGACGATFVEQSMKIAEDLRDNLHRTRLVESAVIRQMDVFAFLREAPTPFGVIFVAPPQWVNLWPAALKILDVEPKWLDEVGVIVVQHYPAEYEVLALKNLVECDQRRYGGVQLVFYKPR